MTQLGVVCEKVVSISRRFETSHGIAVKFNKALAENSSYSEEQKLRSSDLVSEMGNIGSRLKELTTQAEELAATDPGSTRVVKSKEERIADLKARIAKLEGEDEPKRKKVKKGKGDDSDL